jgi:hypothetical protein
LPQFFRKNLFTRTGIGGEHTVPGTENYECNEHERAHKLDFYKCKNFFCKRYANYCPMPEQVF